jgi:hypothetical protein
MDDRMEGFGMPVFWLIGLLIVGVAFLFVGGGDSSTPQPAGVESHNNLSNNEVFTNPQVNMFSDVTNEFYDCNALGACQFQYDSSQHSTESNVRTIQTVNGDRNIISHPDGTIACESRTSPGQFSPTYCEE